MCFVLFLFQRKSQSVLEAYRVSGNISHQHSQWFDYHPMLINFLLFSHWKNRLRLRDSHTVYCPGPDAKIFLLYFSSVCKTFGTEMLSDWNMTHE